MERNVLSTTYTSICIWWSGILFQTQFCFNSFLVEPPIVLLCCGVIWIIHYSVRTFLIFSLSHCRPMCIQWVNMRVPLPNIYFQIIYYLKVLLLYYYVVVWSVYVKNLPPSLPCAHQIQLLCPLSKRTPKVSSLKLRRRKTWGSPLWRARPLTLPWRSDPNQVSTSTWTWQCVMTHIHVHSRCNLLAGMGSIAPPSWFWYIFYMFFFSV